MKKAILFILALLTFECHAQGISSFDKKDVEKLKGLFTDGPGGFEYSVHVLGCVVTPGIYKVGTGTRMNEVIARALGITWDGDVTRVKLIRTDDDSIQSMTTEYNLYKYRKMGDLDENPFLIDNDVVFVPSVEEREGKKG